MSSWFCRLALAVLCAGLGVPAFAQPASPIRLKARTFVPPANLHGNPAARGALPRAKSTASPRQHLILQFDDPITSGDLRTLADAGATALRYVPDNALVISAGPDFDPAGITGARWAGQLEPADRVSADTAIDLSAPTRSYARTVIEFHPDVTRAIVDARLAAARARRIAAPRLPPYVAVVTSDRAALEALAADETVAWIYPAAASLVGGGILACEGTMTGEGIVANFATVGDGWDGPGLNGVTLSSFLQIPSVDIGVSAQQAELARALNEWSRYIDVRWTAGQRADENQSVTILWGATDHGDGFPFSPEVLAHTFYPVPLAPETIAGDLHFNEDYLWGAGDTSRYDIFSVALHEIGHALGLAHSSNPDSVMYAMYRGIVTGLTDDDIAAGRSLYAPAGPSTFPAGWTNTGIGPGVGGGVVARDSTFTIDATGRDVWDTADELRFVSTPLNGDGDIVARVDSVEAVNRWTKAGVMIRATTAPGSPHAFMLVSGGKGLAFQRRRIADGLTVSTDDIPGTAPQWLWLSRRGETVDAYAAADGQPWRYIGSDTILLGSTVLAGLAVSSHDPAAVATAVFSQVLVTPSPAWSSADVGAAGRAGSWIVAGTGGHLLGAGEDVWDDADAFHYTWKPLRGDGEIVARVSSLEFVRSWSKAGVMIRANLTPGSPHAFMLTSAGKGYAFQRRAEQGGWSSHTPGGTGAAPQWLRLLRRGNTFSAYRSDNGTSWVLVGTETILMPRDVLVGLAVSSHTATATSRAVFEHVVIR